MTTEEYHPVLLKFHCRYTQMHPSYSHHETYGAYITAECKHEAELILRMRWPKALKVWVYEGERVYAHAEKTSVYRCIGES